MKKSETILEIVKALAKAQSQFKVAVFDKKNPHFKSSYASLESVHNAVREGLSANGLAIAHLIEDGKMVTTLFHTSGEWIGCELALPANLSPQQLGSALTYFRRYSICCLLAIPSGEDDDGNDAEKSHHEKPKADVFCLTFAQCEEVDRLLAGNDDLKSKILLGYKVKHLYEIPGDQFRLITENINKYDYRYQ
jgi:hypothetical protein